MTETRGRGRPRPQETVTRDEQVYELLSRGGSLTRDELAALVRSTPHLTYLSLWRLARERRVRRVPNTENGRQTNRWEIVQ